MVSPNCRPRVPRLRSWLWVYGVAVIAVWLGAPLAYGAKAAAPSKPNIVFILIDDMGWADGGCFGSRFYQTPNMDRLAAEATRFTQGYASCAVCSPTRAAIMTGKAPARLHITDYIAGEKVPDASRFLLPDWQKWLPSEETTIPEALKPLGYTTAAIGKWHLGGGEFLPEHQGFDVNVAGGPMGSPNSYFWPFGKPEAPNRVPGLAEAGGGEGEYLTDRLTDEALKFIESNRNKPFFLYLAHYAVHSPLMGKPELIERASERPPANGQANAVYAAMVKSVDEGVGRILDKLDQLDLARRTIVVFTSDNGGAVHFGTPPATSNAPLRSGKGNPYEGGLRVPWLVKVPWLNRPGSICDAPVISHDFFPTLLELIGASKAAGKTAVDGVSFVPLLEGGSEPMHKELFWHYPHYWNRGKVSPYSVVRSGDYKLIRFYETGREELYDLAADLSEQHDLASVPDLGPRRRDLSARLDAWLEQVHAQMPVPRPGASSPR